MARSFKKSISALFIFLLFPSSSFAGGISEIGIGGSYTAAMGSAYTSLGKAKPLGLDAKVAMDVGIGESTRLMITGIFQKFDLANMPAPGASIYLLGAFGGLELRSLGSSNDHSGISMSFAAQLGGTYDWLVFKDTTSSTQNSGFNIAGRFSPGVSLGVGNSMAVGMDFPVTFVFLKSPISFWSGVLSLKLKMI